MEKHAALWHEKGLGNVTGLPQRRNTVKLQTMGGSQALCTEGLILKTEVNYLCKKSSVDLSYFSCTKERITD